MPPVLLCCCSCPDDATATLIADALVGEGLAACVSIVSGVRSTYRWEGQLQHADELQLWIKLPRASLERLKRRLVELHPYDVPELIAIEVVDGLPAYLAWVAGDATPVAETGR